MSLLYRVFFTWKCKDSHHKLALDALRHLRGEQAEAWMNLFLTHIEPYLKGAKDPDKKFKDFRNHVLHVREQYWGGAGEAVEQWYGQTVEALVQRKWSTAAYNAGVLGHYFTDALRPLHTGQTEEAGVVRRAVDWSLAKSYDELQQILEDDLGGYPKLEAPSGRDWLGRMLRQGAESAHAHFDAVIDHYNLDAAVRNPSAGFDQELKDRLARLIGHAVVGLARVLEKAIAEAAVDPPRCRVTVPGLIESSTVPLFWVTRKLAQCRDQAAVEAIYREYQETGKVLAALPEDEKEVRRLHAAEVLRTPLEQLDKRAPRAIGGKHGTGAPDRTRTAAKADADSQPAPEKRETRPTSDSADTAPVRVDDNHRPTEKFIEARQAMARPTQNEQPQFLLSLDAPVIDAPSIGAKTAARLSQLGVKTVAELLNEQPESLAKRINLRHVDAGVVRDWQSQATLMLRIPGLRTYEAQMIVACGIREPEQLAAARPEQVLAHVEDFLATEQAERIIRSGHVPDLDDIAGWIRQAGRSRALQAA